MERHRNTERQGGHGEIARDMKRQGERESERERERERERETEAETGRGRGGRKGNKFLWRSFGYVSI